MIINGTIAGETLDGTEFDDVIWGFEGNDTLNGLGGNDTLNGGTGTDQVNGGDGDDTIILDVATVAGEIISGGAGTDSIEVRTQTGLATTEYVIGPLDITSVERLVFASTAGSAIQVVTSFGKIASSGLTEVVGGDGRDIVLINTGAGSFTMPVLTFTNWSALALNAWDFSGDFVGLIAGPAGSTLTASNAIDSTQALIGLNGNDILNGSANADLLNGGGGVNTLYGNGGNDSLAITNRTNLATGVTTFFTGNGSLIDGGDGFDVLSVGGSVNFLGTLANIEGIYFQPASATQVAAELGINATRLAMLPTNLFLAGAGTLQVVVSGSENFDGSLYSFEAGSNVTFLIDYENDVSGFVGTTTLIGTSGRDVFDFGEGTIIVTGGAGADTFELGEGTMTVTDFTPGLDRLDISDSGITGEQRLADFIVQSGPDLVIQGSSGGETTTFTLQGISLGDIDFARDAIFASNSGDAFDEDMTEFDDLIFGFSGNDVLNGLGGNDRLYGGGGSDKLYGGDGDDRLILDGLISGGGTYDGGAGSDTLELRAAAHNLVTAVGAYSNYGLAGPAASTVGIETLQFASDSETGVFASLLVGNVTAMGLTTVIGGDGLDTLFIMANVGGSFTMPDLVLVDWSPASGVGVAGDALVLTGNAGANYTLIAREGLAATQSLLGNDGNDTLTGSSGRDVLNGRGGINQLSGLGGDDVLVIANGTPMSSVGGVLTPGTLTTFTGAGSSFDGGDGTDYLSVGGAVEFLGSLTSIEGIYFQAAFTSTNAGLASQAAAELYLTGATIATLPTGLLLGGTGTLSIDLDPGDNFDGAGFVFAAGSAITLEIEGSSTDDRIVLTAVADSVDGIGGSDTVVFAGNSSDYLVAAGGGGEVLVGADSFVNVELYEFADGTFRWDGTQLVSAEIEGVVADGYIAGATVFIDVNDNGILDAGEYSTVTDADGDFTLVSADIGTLRAIRGTNIDTGLDNLLTLAAPEGASVINPLTTLIQALIDDGFTAQDAELEVETALGLTGLDLLDLDLIEAAAAGGSESEAFQAQQAAASIAEILNAVVEAGGNEAAAIGSIATLVDSGSADLTDTQILTTVIEDSTIGLNLTAEQVSQLVEETAAITGVINEATTLDAISAIQGNNPPVADADGALVNEDASVTGNILTNDSTGDESTATDVLAVTSVNSTAVASIGQTIVAGLYGTLSIAANGSFSYSANADIVDAYPAGTPLLDEFSYSISDGNGGIATSSLSVSVTTIADTVVAGPPVKGIVTGTGGDDFILGSTKSDILNGGSGADRITGGAGADKLHGGDGFDSLFGGAGDDRLYGGTGDDVLFGGAGADRLEGGAGFDTFVFGAESGSDTIADFRLGVDHLHLDGVTVCNYSSSSGSLLVNLSGGGSILLAGIAASSDTTLLFGNLPEWAVI